MNGHNFRPLLGGLFSYKTLLGLVLNAYRSTLSKACIFENRNGGNELE
jgi:hypothetical protein